MINPFGGIPSRIILNLPQWIFITAHWVTGDWLEVKEEGGKAKGEKARRDLCDQAAPVQWTTTGNVVTITLSVATAGHGYNLTYRMEKSPPIGNSEYDNQDQFYFFPQSVPKLFFKFIFSWVSLPPPSVSVVYVYVCMCICVCVFAYICISVCLWVCVPVCLYV